MNKFMKIKLSPQTIGKYEKKERKKKKGSSNRLLAIYSSNLYSQETIICSLSTHDTYCLSTLSIKCWKGGPFNIWATLIIF